jgi:hypothetical protein
MYLPPSRSWDEPGLGVDSRNQIASTIETSYTHLPFNDAFSILFFKDQDTESLHKLINEVRHLDGQPAEAADSQRGWQVRPGTSQITFPNSTKADIRIFAQKGEENAPSLDVLKGKGVGQGVPMQKMVGPSLHLAAQLEMIV